MNKEQRKWLADGLRELANLAIAGLVFGQFLSERFNLTITMAGLFIGALCYIVGVILVKKWRKK